MFHGRALAQIALTCSFIKALCLIFEFSRRISILFVLAAEFSQDCVILGFIDTVCFTVECFESWH